jgi:hypothetical protein
MTITDARPAGKPHRMRVATDVLATAAVDPVLERRNR